MKSYVLVFGIKYDIIERILERGYSIILVNEERTINAEEYISIKYTEARDGDYNLEAICSRLKKYRIVGYTVCKDYYVLLAELVAEQINKELVVLGSSRALVIRDKYELRERLSSYGVNLVRYCSLDKNKIYDDVCAKLGNTFIAKPKSEVLGNGIFIIRNEKDWFKWKMAKKENCLDYYFEEYLEDIKEYCCDTIIAEGKVLVQFTGEYTVSCLTANIENCGYGVNFPGFCKEEDIYSLKDATRKIINLLGINNGFCHIEFIRKNNLWIFSDLGVRIPGGYQIPVESMIARTNLTDLYIRIMLMTEQYPNKVINIDGQYYGWYFYPKKEGVIKKINKDLDYQWLIESTFFANEGDYVKNSQNYSAILARVVYRANSLQELKQFSEKVKQLVTVEYQ